VLHVDAQPDVLRQCAGGADAGAHGHVTGGGDGDGRIALFEVWPDLAGEADVLRVGTL
jgi:hypothetical protein